MAADTEHSLRGIKALAIRFLCPKERGARAASCRMWPPTDRTAAAFSGNFYGGIAAQLKDGPVYLAGVLQQVRRRFYETCDPTTFYGNANLQVVTQ